MKRSRGCCRYCSADVAYVSLLRENAQQKLANVPSPDQSRCDTAKYNTPLGSNRLSQDHLQQRKPIREYCGRREAVINTTRLVREEYQERIPIGECDNCYTLYTTQ